MSTAYPLVSVIIPAYNAEATIAGAISSVFDGTQQNLEVVVCDDSSSDRTLEVVRAMNDPRIKLLCNDRNLGPGLSRDKAIDASAGEWLTFLDADDEWTPHRLENLLNASDGDHGLIVFDDIVLCHDTPNGMAPWRRVHGGRAFGSRSGDPVEVPPVRWASARHFVMQPLISSCAVREFGVYHSGRRFHEDTEFFLRLISKGMRLRYFPTAGYRYRIAPSSLSAVSESGARTREALEDMISLFPNDEEMRAALDRKIRYRTFTSALRGLNLGVACGIALNNPWMVFQLLGRTADMLWYQASRLRHGGANRWSLKTS